MKKRALLALALGLAALVTVAGFFMLRAAGLMPLSMQQNPGTFDRARWEAVVARARALAIAPGETRELRLDDLADPGTLRLRRPGEVAARGQGAGDVWAKKSADGTLVVVIETRDLGHAGEYGFAYSETPLAPSPFAGEWLSLDVPGRLSLVLPRMRIDDHWWEVVYNLD